MQHIRSIAQLMPCPFTGPKMFWAGPNFLCQTKNLVTNILCQTKRWFAFSKIGFCAGTKTFWRGTKCSQIFGLAQKIWKSTKHFGTCKRTRHWYLVLHKTSSSLLFRLVISMPQAWPNWCSSISLYKIGQKLIKTYIVSTRKKETYT